MFNPTHQSKTSQVSSSSSSTSSMQAIPKKWQWIKGLIDEAHLPKLGLPVKWNTTQEEHMKIAYDPQNKQTYNLETHQQKGLKGEPVGFIKSSKNKNPMPGSQTPDAVRFELFKGLERNKVIDPTDESMLIPCMAHGDFVKVESLQADHLQAKTKIIKRQKELVNQLNEDKDFAKFVMQLPGMHKFFVKTQMKGDTEEHYYGTLFFYELYFNDIDNLWLICQACNLHKSDDDTLNWLTNQWLFGEEFIDYLERQAEQNNQAILTKLANRKGLAEVAIEWFWDRHGTYIANAKEFLKECAIPIKILNQTLDKLIGEGKKEAVEQLAAGIELKQGMIEQIIQTDEIYMPEAAKVLHQTPLEVLDKQGNKVPYTTPAYTNSANKVTSELPSIIQEAMQEEIMKQELKKRKIDDLQPKNS